MLNNLINDIRTILSLRKDIREDSKTWIQYPQDFNKLKSEYDYPEAKQNFLINSTTSDSVDKIIVNSSVSEVPSEIVYPDTSDPLYSTFIDNESNRTAIGAFKIESLYKLDTNLVLPSERYFWISCYCLNLEKINETGDGFLTAIDIWNTMVANTSQIPDVAGVWVKRAI